MSRKLVAYFSASGVTAALAARLAEAVGADLFEIEPAVRYTKADLDWRDPASRSTVEMKDAASRPAVAQKCGSMAEYDTIFVGFPIWWGKAPTIVNTFLEGYELAGKTVVSYATSGGSGMGKTNEWLAPSCPGAKLVEGKVLNPATALSELDAWVQSLNL